MLDMVFPRKNSNLSEGDDRADAKSTFHLTDFTEPSPENRQHTRTGREAARGAVGNRNSPFDQGETKRPSS